MKLKIKRTCYGSPDGLRVDEYKAGETYEVRESLAAIFLKEGWAVKADASTRKTKNADAAPENKTAKTRASRSTKRRGG